LMTLKRPSSGQVRVPLVGRRGHCRPVQHSDLHRGLLGFGLGRLRRRLSCGRSCGGRCVGCAGGFPVATGSREGLQQLVLPGSEVRLNTATPPARSR
jgi:hypothetical protein